MARALRTIFLGRLNPGYPPERGPLKGAPAVNVENFVPIRTGAH